MKVEERKKFCSFTLKYEIVQNNLKSGLYIMEQFFYDVTAFDTSTSLYTGGTFNYIFLYFHEYLIQHSLKSGGTKGHIRWVKVPGTAPY